MLAYVLHVSIWWCHLSPCVSCTAETKSSEQKAPSCSGAACAWECQGNQLSVGAHAARVFFRVNSFWIFLSKGSEIEIGATWHIGYMRSRYNPINNTKGTGLLSSCLPFNWQHLGREIIGIPEISTKQGKYGRGVLRGGKIFLLIV